MEIEEKIIKEIKKASNDFKNDIDLDIDLIDKVNKLIVYQSTSVTDREKLEKDALVYLENKIFDIIK